MIARLRSGKFWLKALAISTLLLAGAEIGLRLTLHQIIFSKERLSSAAQSFQADTRRQIHFSADVGRTWFPRPTLTLRNITVSQPGNNHTDIRISEMKIGLAWKTLFGSMPEIEKWVIKQPVFTLQYLGQGQWNLQNLWQSSRHPVRINRLIAEQVDLTLAQNGQSYPLFIDKFTLNRQTSDYQYQAQGKADLPRLKTIKWQAEGSAQPESGRWRFPGFRLNANGSLADQTLALQLDGNLSQKAQNTWQADNLKLTADSPYRHLHLSAAAPQAEWQDDRFSFQQINSFITAQEDHTQWDGTLNLDRLGWHKQTLNITNLTLDGSRKSQDSREIFNLHSPVSWQEADGWKLPNLELLARQEPARNNNIPRFAIRMNGWLDYPADGAWQTELSGLFDQQEGRLKASFQPDQRIIQANANLKKLNLLPYLADAERLSAQARYPDILQGDRAIQLVAELSINTLQLPNLNIDNLNGRLKTDSRHITLDSTADLYGGSSQGTLSIQNAQPLNFRLQQHTHNISILPLLQDLLGYGNLKGTGDAVIDFTAQGGTRNELMRTLNGDLQLSVRKGAWMGIDMNHILQGGDQQSIRFSPGKETPFEHFTLSSHITDGIGKHQNAELRANNLHMLSTGSTDLIKQTLYDNLLLNTTGGQGKTLPLLIKGPIANPSITIDYPSLTRGLDTPEQKQKVLTDTLKQQWNWLSPPKPASGTP